MKGFDVEGSILDRMADFFKHGSLEKRKGHVASRGRHVKEYTDKMQNYNFF